MDTYLSGWRTLTADYLADAWALLTGNVTAMTIVAAAGVALLVAGLLVAVVQRVRRVQRMIAPAILTLLWPFVVLFIEGSIGWFGRILISIFGVGAMLIWVGLIVGLAPNKLPLWLIGLGLACFIAYFGLVTLVPLLL